MAVMPDPPESRPAPVWLDEKDWLCIVETLPQHDPRGRAMGAEAIGYFFAYAQLTDTRMLAFVGDAEWDAYELLFSFPSPEDKTFFLKLIQSNELTETEPELLHIPTEEEIREAQPIGAVLPADVAEYATLLASTFMIGTVSEIVN